MQDDSLKWFKKQVSRNESGVLAQLFRYIIIDNNFIPALDMLVKRYVEDTTRKEVNLQPVKRKTKSTLLSNIGSEEMTFKTFLDLLFNFLRVRKVNISVKLTFYNGNETIHSISVDKGDYDIGGEGGIDDDKPTGTESKAPADAKRNNTKSAKRNSKRN